MKQANLSIFNPFMTSCIRLWTLICIGLTISALASKTHSQSVLVTISEDPGQQSSTLSGVDVFTFDAMSNGNYANVVWSGVGTFDQLMVHQGGTVFGALDPTSPWGINSQQMTVGNIVNSSWGSELSSTTLNLDQDSSYFGLYWAAGDGNDLLQFYSGDSLVAEFTTQTMIQSAALTWEYYGDPYQGTNKIEPYAFINFYGDATTHWDRVVITQSGPSSGFEVDNLTSRVDTFNPNLDDWSELGNIVAEVSETTVTATDNESSTWSFAGDSGQADASHISSSSLYLGASQPTGSGDDEDGIVTLTTLEAGKIGLIQATVYGDGYLHAWADFNNNGSFDSDEAILVNYPVSTGNEVIPILISPSSLTGADVQFRFRLSNQTDLAATGASTEGEVEDYQFTISDAGIGYVYYPGEGQFYTFAAEDTWPDTFDYDLNDVVMIYRNTLVIDASTTDVIRLDINGQLTAYGAGYHNGFAVHVPGLDKSAIDSSRTLLTKNAVPQVASPLESGASEAVVIVSSDLRSESIMGECVYHRVDPSCTSEAPKFSFHAYLPLLNETPQASMPTGAFDPFIFAAGQHRGSIIGDSPGRPLEIHSADFAPTSVGDAISSSYYGTEDDDSSNDAPGKYYKTASNMPWAIIIPAEWNHPSEYIDISEAYPNFPAWVTSGGETYENWYLSDQANTSKTWTVAD